MGEQAAAGIFFFIFIPVFLSGDVYIELSLFSICQTDVLDRYVSLYLIYIPWGFHISIPAPGGVPAWQGRWSDPIWKSSAGSMCFLPTAGSRPGVAGLECGDRQATDR